MWENLKYFGHRRQICKRGDQEKHFHHWKSEKRARKCKKTSNKRKQKCWKGKEKKVRSLKESETFLKFHHVKSSFSKSTSSSYLNKVKLRKTMTIKRKICIENKEDQEKVRESKKTTPKKYSKEKWSNKSWRRRRQRRKTKGGDRERKEKSTNTKKHHQTNDQNRSTPVITPPPLNPLPPYIHTNKTHSPSRTSASPPLRTTWWWQHHETRW